VSSWLRLKSRCVMLSLRSGGTALWSEADVEVDVLVRRPSLATRARRDAARRGRWDILAVVLVLLSRGPVGVETADRA